MPELMVNGIAIDDTFAEAFDMRATAIVITAPTERWAAQAATTMTRFRHLGDWDAAARQASRAILSPQQTPDGRSGARVLMFAVSTAELQRQLQNRVGQCVLTSPGSACYAGSSWARQTQARRCNSFLRRRLADRQAARPSTILARTGDGRRVRLQIRPLNPHQESGRRRQSHCHG